MSRLFKGTCFWNLKSVSLTILEQLAFNAQKFMGSCVPGHALFSENFKGVMSGVSLGTCLSNLNSITLTVLEQLTFNAQKYRGERYPWYAPFLKNFSKSHVRTVAGNAFVKFEVPIYNHVAAISI